MSRTNRSIFLPLLALVAGLWFAASPAYALKLEGFKIQQVITNNHYPEIHVKFDRVADNWTLVTNDAVVVRMEYEITVKATYALSPDSEISMDLDNMDIEVPLLSTNSSYSEFHTDNVEFRRAGSGLVEIRAAALTTCQTIRGNGGKPSKEHRIPKMFKATAMAEAYTTATWFTEESSTDTTLVRVDVVCDLDPDWHQPIKPATDVAVESSPFRPSSIEVFLTTYQNQVTHPNPGTSCKKLHVKVRIEANKIGSVTYKLWRQPGEARSRTKMVMFRDSGPFKGRFIAEDVFIETFDRSTYVQYMAEIGGTPVGISTQWKDINILCTSGGGGGLIGGGSGDEPPPPRGLKAPTVKPPPPPVPPTKKAPQRLPPR